MRNLLFFFLMLAGAVNILYGQSNEANQLAGKKAIQFSIGSNFKLYSIDGTIFSLKYHFTEKSAFRIGISSAYDKDNSNSKTEQNIDSILYESDQKTKDFSFTINTYFMHYFQKTGTFRGYIGIGPYFIYSKRDKKSQSTIYVESKFDSKAYGIGIKNILGVEWRVKPNISIFGEYGIAFGYYKASSENTQSDLRLTDMELIIRNNDNESKSFSITPRAVQMGVAIYF